MSPRVRSGLEVTARMKNRWPTTDTDHGGARGDHIVLSILYESCIRPITTLSTLPAASVGAVPPLLVSRRSLASSPDWRDSPHWHCQQKCDHDQFCVRDETLAKCQLVVMRSSKLGCCDTAPS